MSHSHSMGFMYIEIIIELNGGILMSEIKVRETVIHEIEKQKTIVGKIKVIIKDYDTNIASTPPGAELDTETIRAYVNAYFDKGCFSKEQEERQKKQRKNKDIGKMTDSRNVAIHSFDGLLGTWRTKGYIILKDNVNYLKDEEGMTISKIIDGTVKSNPEDKHIAINIDESVEQRIEEFIDNGIQQIILTGAPGTGKTYSARNVAIKLVLGSKYDDYLNMNEQQKNQIENILNGKSSKSELLEEFKDFSGQLGFVQFHPSYDYTDFIEGIRPKKDNTSGGIGFEYKPGVFMEFCNRAAESYNQVRDSNKYVFIIDEINRADLSKVFGELMFGLESDYRGKIIKTQYENLRDNQSEFFIPKNVYIIGTMNDIDRSVSTFDFALRRRFAWMEIKAEDVMSDALKVMLPDYQYLDNLIDDALKLNEVISDKGRNFGLNYSYHLGHAYFSKIDTKPNLDYLESKQKLWNYYLQPILKEYVRGYDYDKVEEFILNCRDTFI